MAWRRGVRFCRFLLFLCCYYLCFSFSSTVRTAVSMAEVAALIAEHEGSLMRLANLGLKVKVTARTMEATRDGETTLATAGWSVSRGGGGGDADEVEALNRYLVTDVGIPASWTKEEGDGTTWSIKRVKWCFVSLLFGNDRFLERLGTLEERDEEERELMRLQRDDPNLPVLESAFVLPSRNCLQRFEDGTARDFVNAIPVEYRRAVTAGAMDTEASPRAAICCLSVEWEGGRHHLVVWMRDPDAAGSLAQLMSDIASEMHSDFRWCSWGGPEAESFNCVDVQGMCDGEERRLVDAHSRCTGTSCRKNQLMIGFWNRIDDDSNGVLVPGVDWRDNESVVAHMTGVVREGPMNICIADTFAVLAVLAAVNSRTENEGNAL